MPATVNMSSKWGFRSSWRIKRNWADDPFQSNSPLTVPQSLYPTSKDRGGYVSGAFSLQVYIRVDPVSFDQDSRSPNAYVMGSANLSQEESADLAHRIISQDIITLTIEGLCKADIQEGSYGQATFRVPGSAGVDQIKDIVEQAGELAVDANSPRPTCPFF
jgi:hypothetical protein